MKDKDQKLIWEAYGQPEGSLQGDMKAASDAQFAAAKAHPGDYHPKNFPDKSYEMADKRGKQMFRAYHIARIITVLENEKRFHALFLSADEDETFEKLAPHIKVEKDPSNPDGHINTNPDGTGYGYRSGGTAGWEPITFKEFLNNTSKALLTGGVLIQPPLTVRRAVDLWKEWSEDGKPELDVKNWSENSRER